MPDGQVVLITGAARGVGRYIAHTFAEAGAQLAVADIRPVETVTAELQALGAKTMGLNADVRDEDAVHLMMERVAAEFGRIDVLVNNAAIPTHAAWEPIWPAIRDMEKSFWDRVFDTNMGGTFLCTKHVLPYMERQGRGHIVNLYGGGDPKSVGSCAYVTSKAAIRM